MPELSRPKRQAMSRFGIECALTATERAFQTALANVWGVGASGRANPSFNRIFSWPRLSGQPRTRPSNDYLNRCSLENSCISVGVRHSRDNPRG
jgi:hypothetical protein